VVGSLRRRFLAWGFCEPVREAVDIGQLSRRLALTSRQSESISLAAPERVFTWNVLGRCGVDSWSQGLWVSLCETVEIDQLSCRVVLTSRQWESVSLAAPERVFHVERGSGAAA